MTLTKKYTFMLVSIIVMVAFFLGCFFIDWVINFPIQNQTGNFYSFSELDDFTTLGGSSAITFIPKELRDIDKESPDVLDTDPKKGNEDANIEIVLFSDMVSEASYVLTPEIMKVVDNHSDEVLLSWKDFPIPRMYGSSLTAAIGARCVQDQDEDKFWEMRDLIVANRENITNEKLVDLAGQLDLDNEAFSECLSDSDIKVLVQRNYLEAKILGLDMPPIFYINGEKYTGKYQYKEILNYINEL